jgi:hypothetical protein
LGAVLIAMAVSLPACERRDTAKKPPSATAPAIEASLPDRVEDDGRVRKHVYYPDNPVTRARVEAAQQWGDVGAAMGVYEIHGYELAPEYSCAVDGFTDEVRIELTAIAMRSLSDPDRMAMVVATETDGARAVVPLEFSRAPTADPGFEPLAESIWMRPFDALGTLPGVERFDDQQLNDFINCLYFRLPEDAMRCILFCRYWGMGWVECTVVCVGASFVGRIATCIQIAFMPKKEYQTPCTNCGGN